MYSTLAVGLTFASTLGCASVQMPDQVPVSIVEHAEVAVDPEADRDRLWRKLDEVVMSCLPAVADPNLEVYVRSVGDRLVARGLDADGRARLTSGAASDGHWTFRLMAEHRLLAFALPGRYVYLPVGMLVRLRNEAELAAILAHEMGHELAGHGEQAMLAFLDAGDAVMPFPAETEADRIAIGILTASGYETDSLARVLRMLAQFLPDARRDLLRRAKLIDDIDPPASAERGRKRFFDALDGAVLLRPGVALTGLEGWTAEAHAASPCSQLVFHAKDGRWLGISSVDDPPQTPGDRVPAPRGYALYVRGSQGTGGEVEVFAAMRGPNGVWRKMEYRAFNGVTVQEGLATVRNLWSPAPGVRLRVVRALGGETVQDVHAAQCPDADLGWMQSVSPGGPGVPLASGEQILCTDSLPFS